MLKHIICTNIIRHLEQYRIFNDEQHGFIRGQSCETHLALSVNDLAKILDTQSQADVVIKDFSNALDHVPHQTYLEAHSSWDHRETAQPSWAEHVRNRVTKANKVIGLLHRSLYSCSPFVKETAYVIDQQFQQDMGLYTSQRRLPAPVLRIYYLLLM